MAEGSNVLDGLNPIVDDDVDRIIAEMRSKMLATDQMMVAAKALDGRSLSCKHGSKIIAIVHLGIMQRKLAMEVLRGRLNDLPDGLPDLLEPLQGEIRKEVGAICGNGAALPPPPLKIEGVKPYCPPLATAALPPAVAPSALPSLSKPELPSLSKPVLPSLSKPVLPATLPRDAQWEEPMERLRRDVCTPEVPLSIYNDVAAVFDALGLPPLPARAEARSVPPLEPGAVTVGFQSAGGGTPTLPPIGNGTPVLPPVPQPQAPLPPDSNDAEYMEQLRLLAEAQANGFEGDAQSNVGSEESV